MHPGQMRYRATLQRRSVSKGATGQVAPSFSTVAEVWAALESSSGTERVIGGALVNATTHRVTIRSRSDFADASGRILIGGKALAVVGVTASIGERSAFTAFDCAEGAADA